MTTTSFQIFPAMHVTTIPPAIQGIFDVVEGLSPYAAIARATLHSYPETRYDTDITTSYLVEELEHALKNLPEGLDARIVGGYAKGGFWVDIDPKGADLGKRLAFVADFDALDVGGPEQTGLSFASKTNVMHACGHDMHAAALLAFGKAVLTGEATVDRALRLVFQDAEENIGTPPDLESGAQKLIASGALEGVAQVAKWHINPFGRPGFAVSPGAFFGNTDRIMVGIKWSSDSAVPMEYARARVIKAIDNLFPVYPRYGGTSDLISVEPILITDETTPHNIIPDRAGFVVRCKKDEVKLVGATIEGAKRRVFEEFPGVKDINVQYSEEDNAFSVSIATNGGHVMAPDRYVNALRIEANLIDYVDNEIFRRDMSFADIDIRGSGGASVEPKLLISVRTFFDYDEEQKFLAMIEKAARSALDRRLYEMSFERLPGTPAPVNDEEFAKGAAERFAAAGLQVYPAPKFLAGEDFGFYARHVPSLFFGIAGENPNPPVPPHSAKFNPDPRVLKYGIAAWMLLAGARV